MSVVVKAGAAARELLVAWYFGTSDAVDAYVIAYTVPYFLITVVAGSLPAVLIPAYIRIRRERGATAGDELLSLAGAMTALVLIPVILALSLGASTYLPLLAGGFSPVKLELSAQLTTLLTPTLITSCAIAMLGAALNAHNRFVLPALSPLVTTSVAVASLVALAPGMGIRALAWGTLAGSAVEGCVLFVALRRERVVFRLPQRSLVPELRDVAGQFGHAFTGSLLMGGTLLVDQAIAALLPAGSVAALSYATRIVTFPLGLTAAALGTVVLPYFSHAVSRREWDAVNETLRHYLRLIFLIGVPAALAIAALADPLVRLLLSHGSFSAGAVPTVAGTLAALAVQIPFYTGVILLMRLAAAMRLNAAVAWISGVNLAVNAVLDFWLSSFLGVAGIALSTSFVYLCSFGLLFWLVRRKLAAVQASSLTLQRGSGASRRVASARHTRP